MPVDLKEYTDVAARIALFYKGYPNGRLVTERVEIWTDVEPARVVVKALAYRSPDDPHPGSGWSWMTLPGTTNFTRGSELENTETSAWGRAIGSLGIGIKGSVASTDEIAGHKGDEPETRKHPGLVDGDPPEQTSEGGLIGIAVASERYDFNKRPSPDGGYVLPFKIKSGSRSIRVLAEGPLADALDIIKSTVIDQRVTVWGHWTDEVTPGTGLRPDVNWRLLHVERMQTPDGMLTVPVTVTEPEPIALGLT